MSKPTIQLPASLFACCKKPAIENMDYFNHSPGDWHNPDPRVNRVCTKCFAHWFGTPDSVRQFTRKEWDAELETA